MLHGLVINGLVVDSFKRRYQNLWVTIVSRVTQTCGRQFYAALEEHVGNHCKQRYTDLWSTVLSGITRTCVSGITQTCSRHWCYIDLW